MKTHGLTVEYLKENGLIIFEAIVGSKAYGLDLPTSDTDIRGVYMLKHKDYFAHSYQDQVNDATNDTVYYELGKFLSMLQSNNPTVLELLHVPEKMINVCSDTFKSIMKDSPMFLTKMARKSFGGYAIQQIKKARGLKKKIVNPMPKERKTIEDFCRIIWNGGTVKLKDYLKSSGYEKEKLGAHAIEHTRDSYALFYQHPWVEETYRGISKEGSNEIRLTAIPKGEKPIATMTFCADTYTKYCKEYKEYWEWVEKRNPVRYETNQEHGKGYDSKNMMHCVRLLRMANELAETGKLNVFREDREELLAIRRGDVDYADLLADADALVLKMDEAFRKSDLPEANIPYEELNEYVADKRMAQIAEFIRIELKDGKEKTNTPDTIYK